MPLPATCSRDAKPPGTHGPHTPDSSTAQAEPMPVTTPETGRERAPGQHPRQGCKDGAGAVDRKGPRPASTAGAGTGLRPDEDCGGLPGDKEADTWPKPSRRQTEPAARPFGEQRATLTFLVYFFTSQKQHVNCEKCDTAFSGCTPLSTERWCPRGRVMGGDQDSEAHVPADHRRAAPPARGSYRPSWL